MIGQSVFQHGYKTISNGELKATLMNRPGNAVYLIFMKIIKASSIYICSITTIRQP